MTQESLGNEDRSNQDTETTNNSNHSRTIFNCRNQNRLEQRLKENRAFGDSIINSKENCTRILFQNINSIRPKSMTKWDQTLRVMKERQIDILGLAETSANWKLSALVRQFQTTTRKHFSKSVLSTSSNCTISDNEYFPGGTATLSLEKWTGHFINHLHDEQKMGRWSGQKLRLNDKTNLFIVTADISPQSTGQHHVYRGPRGRHR